MSRSVLIAIVLALFVAGVSQANVFFIPGDAFFPSKLTEEVVRAANEDRQPLALGYELPLRFAGFGGYGGFGQLEIRGLNKDMAHAIRDIYDDLRKTNPKRLIVWRNEDGEEQSSETNGFHFFVYPKDVDWEQQRMGLKYNEDWMNLPEEAVAGPDRAWIVDKETNKPLNHAVSYNSLVGTWKSVAEDWQYAKLFPRLPVEVPQGISWGLMEDFVAAPVTIEANQIQLVILEEKSLKSYYARKPSCEFYSITDDQVRRLRWKKNGTLSVTPWSKGDRKSPLAAE